MFKPDNRKQINRLLLDGDKVLLLNTPVWWCRDKAFNYKIRGCDRIHYQAGLRLQIRYSEAWKYGHPFFLRVGIRGWKKEVKSQPEMVKISLDLAFKLQVPGKSHINTVSSKTLRGTQTCDEGFCVRHTISQSQGTTEDHGGTRKRDLVNFLCG